MSSTVLMGLQVTPRGASLISERFIKKNNYIRILRLIDGDKMRSGGRKRLCNKKQNEMILSKRSCRRRFAAQGR